MDFRQLCDSFKNKIENRANYLTEDGIRYLFFSSMMMQDNNDDNYILEYPYSDPRDLLDVSQSPLVLRNTTNTLHQELDILYASENEKIAMEIKFHRKASSNSNKTYKAGSLFNDIQRLNLIKSDCKKYLLYVTDDEMHDYYNNNGLDVFYNNENEKYDCRNIHMTDTFKVAAFKSFTTSSDQINASINLVFKDDVTSTYLNENMNWHIRIYEVCSEFDEMWERIVSHAGEEFHTITGLAFVYEMVDSEVVPTREGTVKWSLSKNIFKKALEYDYSSDAFRNEIIGSSYVRGILEDERISLCHRNNII